MVKIASEIPRFNSIHSYIDVRRICTLTLKLGFCDNSRKLFSYISVHLVRNIAKMSCGSNSSVKQMYRTKACLFNCCSSC